MLAAHICGERRGRCCPCLHALPALTQLPACSCPPAATPAAPGMLIALIAHRAVTAKSSECAWCAGVRLGAARGCLGPPAPLNHLAFNTSFWCPTLTLQVFCGLCV